MQAGMIMQGAHTSFRGWDRKQIWKATLRGQESLFFSLVTGFRIQQGDFSYLRWSRNEALGINGQKSKSESSVCVCENTQKRA